MREIAAAIVVLGVARAVVAEPQAPVFRSLDTEAIGAEAFRKAHPEWDGRGVVIAILDTGVDMGVPGLQTTSTREVKVIEARDFSGEAVVDCELAVQETDQGFSVFRTQTGWVRTPSGRLNPPVYLGFLEEKRFQNASVGDLNGNGRSDDRFAIVVFKDAQGEWSAIVDRDGDGDIHEEEVHRSYAKDRKPILLVGGDPSRTQPPVAIALTIEASEDGPKRVEFHIPTGSHGTHVAGIAAGHRLNGVEGRDGIAPGAQILSLKIGDNRLSGGATVTESMKKALEYAARWSREHDVPVVVNLSYGVGSELEGEADIERFVDRLAVENPRLVMVFSAGNGGPGLSTVGSPAAALHAISVGAVVTPESARDLIGANMTGIEVFHFSSRGGEVAKPDVVAPGIASSSVPYWENSDLFRGTSMAAPQVAGAVALILSALEPGVRWNSGMVKRALIATGAPLPGYGPLDVGGGLVQVGAAHRRLLEMAKDPHAHTLLDFEVRTECPTGPRSQARAVFWRAGGFAPGPERPVPIRIRAVFAADTPDAIRKNAYRSFRLSADDGWVRLSKRNLYLRGDGEASFEWYVDPERIAGSGIHSSLIRGRSGIEEFRIPVTVITPVRATDVDGVPAIRMLANRLKPGQGVRIPLRPPAGAQAMQVSVEPSRDRKAALYVFVFDGYGRRVPIPEAVVYSDEGRKAEFTLSREDFLGSGTMELVLYAVPTAQYESMADVAVRFFSLQAEPIRRFRLEAGKTPFARFEVVQAGEVPFIGGARGVIGGYERTIRKSVDKDVLTEGFSMSREDRAIEFELSLSAEDYARFTDIAVQIFDSRERAIARAGFGTRMLRLRLDNPEPGRDEASYRLEIRAGRAFAGGPSFEIEIRSRHLWSDPIPVRVTLDGQQQFRLYPSVPGSFEMRAASTPKAIPPDCVYSGEVEFVSARDRTVWLRVPIRASLQR